MRVIATRAGHAPAIMATVPGHDGFFKPGEVFECPKHLLALVTDDPICGWMRAADEVEHKRREDERLAVPGRRYAIEPPLHAPGYAPYSMHDATLKDGTR